MEKMKKILSIVLAMVLILTVTACGSKTPPAASEGGGETKQEQAAESEAAQPAAPSGKTVAMIMGSGSSGGTYFALGGAMVIFTFLPPAHVLFADLSGVNTWQVIPY